jgi:hypothetical protein
MRTVRLVALLSLALVLSSCARMQFYTKPDLSGEETGIKFFTPRPYLLVARTGSEEKPVDVQVLYLPDLSKPIYAKASPGYGSADVNITLSNGMLTNFGAKTDSNIAGLLTALGTLDKDLATAGKTRKETGLLVPNAGVNYTEQGTVLVKIATDLKATTAKAPLTELTQNEKDAGAELAGQIDSAGKLLMGPAGEQNLLTALTNLKTASKSWSDRIGKSKATAGPPGLRDVLDRLKTELDGVITKISPKAEDPPTFTLYEIDNSSGTTRLIEVKF